MDSSTGTHFTIARWIKASFLGWLLGVVLIIVLSSLLDSAGIEGMQFYLGLGMGIGVGYTQWQLLKKCAAIGRQWLWYAVAGLGVPFVLLDIVLPDTFRYKLPVGVALGGATVGLLQYLILVKRFPKALAWIWASAVGWTLAVLAVLMVDFTKYLTPYISSNIALAVLNFALILSGGVILGITTGAVLRGILKEDSAAQAVAAESA